MNAYKAVTDHGVVIAYGETAIKCADAAYLVAPFGPGEVSSYTVMPA